MILNKMILKETRITRIDTNSFVKLITQTANKMIGIPARFFSNLAGMLENVFLKVIPTRFEKKLAGKQIIKY